MALKSDGTVVAWGGDAQANVPAGLANVIAIAAGGNHSMALKSDGTVVDWGGTEIPPIAAGIKYQAIAAGYNYSLALKSDGTVVAWGPNDYAQTSVPAGLGNVIAIAAGGFHSLALKSDGTVVAWGLNDLAQTTVPASLGNVIAIAAGNFHSLALVGGATPAITTQPRDVIASASSSVTFSVIAISKAILRYQWRKNGVNILNATNRTYNISNAHASHAGSYTVVVSNVAGSVTSQSAVLSFRDFLITTALPESGGFIQLTPPQPDNGYESGTMVTLTASGTSKFYGWSGSANGTTNIISVKMDGHKTVNAHFTDSKLVWQSGGSLATWFMNGTNLVGSTSLSGLSGGWTMITTFDFDADGSQDFLFQHTNGQLKVWLMDANNLKRATSIGTAAGWRAVGVGDFNDDGKGDILFQHKDSRLALWFMDGSTNTGSAMLNGSRPVGVVWKAVGVAKLNSDNNADIIFQHTSGPIAVWFMDKTILSSSASLSNPGAPWRIEGVGDLNADGKADLVLHHTNGQLAVWYLDGIQLTGSAYLNNGQKVTGWKVVGVKFRSTFSNQAVNIPGKE